MYPKINFPSGISIKKAQIGANYVYIFGDKKIGEIGKIIINDLNGRINIKSEVTSCSSVLLNKRRQEVFEPLSKNIVYQIDKTKALA